MEKYKSKYLEQVEKLEEIRSIDHNLVSILENLKDKGFRAKEIAKYVYDSAEKALNVESIGSDGVDYSGAMWHGFLSSLKRLI
jgi:hypothetical protein